MFFLGNAPDAWPEGDSRMRAEISHQYDAGVLCETQTIPEAVSLSAARVANIDRLRILAAIGIVWFHTENAPYRHIAYAGLPVFLLIFCSLLTSQGWRGTTAEFLKRRWHRLLKPWLFWSAVYGLCRLANALHTGDAMSLRQMLSAETLLAGPSIHLWYLPYAFLVGAVIHAMNRWTSHIREETVILANMAAGTVLLAVHATGVWTHLGRPLPQWEFGLAALPLGVAVGKCLAIPSRDRGRLFLVGIALVVATECQILHRVGLGNPVLPHGIATMMVCLAYCWPIRSDAVVAALSPLAFGVYLIHPLVAHVLHRIPLANDSCLIAIPLTVSVAALAALVLRRTPLRRFV